MSAVLSSPTPSFPSSSVPLHTPDAPPTTTHNTTSTATTTTVVPDAALVSHSPPSTFELKHPPQSRATMAHSATNEDKATTSNSTSDNVPALEPSTSSPSSSVPSSPSTPNSHQLGSGTGGHSSVIPVYPYNVAMVPQMHGPTPDDSGITTRLPSICVDYLSHDWAEDDVWTSWKAMTKHKSEIANGVRLENASWRTWAKQRGNLKTISPETLNWSVDG